MSQWKEYKLDDIVSKLGDGLHGTPKYDPNGDYYFINGSNLIDGNISVNDSTKKVTIEEFNKYKKELNDRTILVSINGTLGNVAVYNNEKVVLGKSACYFNVKETFNKEFLRYVITDRTFQNYIIEQATGTTIKNVPLKAIREFVFKAPDYPTQTAIASILSSLDQKIELNNAINRNLEALAQALFKQWFVEFNFPVDQHGNLSPLSGEMSEGQRGYKDSGGEMTESELGMIPKGWQIGNFSNIGTNVKDNVKPIDFDPIIPYIGLEHIPRKSLSLSKWGISTDVDSNKKRFKQKDILFGKLRPYFHKVITAPFEGISSTDILVIRPVSKFYFGYLLCHLFSDELITYSTNVSGGTRMPRVSWADIERYQICLPLEKVLTEFTSQIDCFIDQIHLNILENLRLSELRDTLLPKLISGELEVKDINTVSV